MRRAASAGGRASGVVRGNKAILKEEQKRKLWEHFSTKDYQHMMTGDDIEKQAATELQPQQERVLRRLEHNDRLLVYHGMGSGKTMTALAAAEKFNMPLTAVGPASLRNNFAKEKKKHHIHADVTALTYNKPPESDVKGVLAFDEAHRMGQYGTQRSHLPEKIHGEKELFLTGTPIRNRPSELIPLMRGLGVHISRDPKEFNKEFVGEYRQNPSLWDRLVHGVKPGTVEHIKNRDVLKKMLHGKVDYHAAGTEGFPRVKEHDVRVEMTKEQEAAYNMSMKQHPDLMYKVRRGIAPAKSESGQMNAFLTASRQISNIPGDYNLSSSLHDAPKLRHAVSSIEKRYKRDPNYRGVSYSTYIGHGIHPMSTMLTQKKIPHAMYTGSMSQSEKDAVVSDYNKGKIKHLLISGAGGEGLDLKGTKLMQIMEPHWNEPQLAQVKARAVRFGSHAHLPEAEREVEIQNFIATPRRHGIIFKHRDMGSDEYLRNMSANKTKLNNEFLGVLKEVGMEKESGLKDFWKNISGSGLREAAAASESATAKHKEASKTFSERFKHFSENVDPKSKNYQKRYREYGLGRMGKAKEEAGRRAGEANYQKLLREKSTEDTRIAAGVGAGLVAAGGTAYAMNKKSDLENIYEFAFEDELQKLAWLKGMAVDAAVPALLGAGAGAIASDEGDTVSGAAKGAAVGAGLGLGMHAAYNRKGIAAALHKHMGGMKK